MVQVAAPPSPIRMRIRVGMVASAMAVLFLMMSELSRLTGEVLDTEGRSWPANALMGLGLPAREGWGARFTGPFAGARTTWMTIYLLLDLAFVLLYLWAAWTAKRTSWKALAVVVSFMAGFDLVEDVLALIATHWVKPPAGVASALSWVLYGATLLKTLSLAAALGHGVLPGAGGRRLPRTARPLGGRRVPSAVLRAGRGAARRHRRDARKRPARSATRRAASMAARRLRARCGRHDRRGPRRGQPPGAGTAPVHHGVAPADAHRDRPDAGIVGARRHRARPRAHLLGRDAGAGVGDPDGGAGAAVVAADPVRRYPGTHRVGVRWIRWRHTTAGQDAGSPWFPRPSFGSPSAATKAVVARAGDIIATAAIVIAALGLVRSYTSVVALYLAGAPITAGWAAVGLVVGAVGAVAVWPVMRWVTDLVTVTDLPASATGFAATLRRIMSPALLTPPSLPARMGVLGAGVALLLAIGLAPEWFAAHVGVIGTSALALLAACLVLGGAVVMLELKLSPEVFWFKPINTPAVPVTTIILAALFFTSTLGDDANLHGVDGLVRTPAPATASGRPRARPRCGHDRSGH